MATRNTLVLLRFDEERQELAPSDAQGSLADLAAVTDPVPLVDGFSGFARMFGPARYYTAQDVVAGSSLTTRDVTVQALVQWDFDAQVASGLNGCIYERGIGGSSAERTSVRVELIVINAALRIAALRFGWQTVAGVEKHQIGGHFVAPSSPGWIMVTATRHWISSTEVEIQYYVGRSLIGELYSADTDIGGGITGTTTIGAARGYGTAQTFAGAIDAVRVLDYQVTQEEVEATYRRFSHWQPGGYTTIKQLMQPGAPISTEPTSRVQRLFKGIGNAIGYANAQIDNFRRNAMPDRAYGPVLDEWERITQEAPRATDTTKQRRARVLGHMAQRQGVTKAGVTKAVATVLQADASQLSLVGYSNDYQPANYYGSGPAGWVIAPNGQAGDYNSPGSFSPYGGSSGFDFRMGSTPFINTLTSGPIVNAFPVSAERQLDGGNRCNMLAKITPGTQPSDLAIGLMFADIVNRNAFMLEIWNNVGVAKIAYTQMINGVLSAPTVLATVSLATAYYLHIYEMLPEAAEFSPGVDYRYFRCEWGTSLTAMSQSAKIAHPGRFQWGATHGRAVSATTLTAWSYSIDEWKIRQWYGNRPFYWQIYRDPSIPGAPDFPTAQTIANRLAHAFTKVGVTANLMALCDDANTGCDLTPIGAW